MIFSGSVMHNGWYVTTCQVSKVCETAVSLYISFPIGNQGNSPIKFSAGSFEALTEQQKASITALLQTSSYMVGSSIWSLKMV